jgi:hypothetical protein
VISSFLQDQISPFKLGPPTHFVKKWIDYSSKYGLGYKMSDHSVGMAINKEAQSRWQDKQARSNYMLESFEDAGLGLSRADIA